MLKLLYPVSPVFVTNPYGTKSPAYTCWTDPRHSFHHGTDLRVRNVPGKEIVAAQNGTVIYVDDTSTENWYENGHKGSVYGVHIIIRHFIDDEVYFTLYGHLDKAYVYEKQEVKAGQPIGVGGNTGKSRGAHLHFELRKEKNYWKNAINAEPYFVETLEPDGVPDWKNVYKKMSAMDVWDAFQNKGYISENSNFFDPVSKGELSIIISRILNLKL